MPCCSCRRKRDFAGARLGISLKGATIYATHQSCFRCADQMIQVGIMEVIYAIDYADTRGLEVLSRGNIPYRKIEIPKLEISILK